MGGRGSSSGISGGSGISSFKGAGVRIESDINGLNKALVNKTLNGVKDTLNEFGIPLNTLNGVGVTDSKKAMASVNGFGDLSLSRTEYSSKNSEFKKSKSRSRFNSIRNRNARSRASCFGLCNA